MMMIFVRLTESCCVVSFRPKLMPDSLGFWIPRYGIWTPGTESWIPYQWDLDSGFQSLVGFGIPDSNLLNNIKHWMKPDSGSSFSDSRNDA